MGRFHRTVLLLGVTSLVADVASEMAWPLLPALILSQAGGSAFYVGLIEGLANGTSALWKLLGGLLADRRPARKPLVVGGYLVSGLARPLLAFAGSPLHVLAVRMTDRVGKGLRTAPRDAMLGAVVTSEEAGRAYGFHRAMDHAGAVLGPLVAAGLLALGWDVPSVLLATVVPGVLAAGCAGLVREPPAPTPHLEAGAAPAEPLSRPFRSLILRLAVFRLGLATEALPLLWLGQQTGQKAAMPLAWAGYNLAQVVGTGLGGGWADRYPRARVIATTQAGTALAALALVLAPPWAGLGAFVLYGGLVGACEPAEKALVRQLAPVSGRGRAFGWYNMLIGSAALASGAGLGGLWVAQGPQAALGLGAGVALLGAAAVWGWRAPPVSAPAPGSP